MMKKSFVALLLVLLCVISSACGNDSEAVSMYDLSRTMLDAANASGEMSYISSAEDKDGAMFSYISDADYSLVGSYFALYAKDGTGNADEIAVIYAKNKSDVNALSDSLKAHLEKRISLYSTYDSTQLPKLKGALVFTSGSYAVLIVSDNAESIKSSFNAFIGK